MNQQDFDARSIALRAERSEKVAALKSEYEQDKYIADVAIRQLRQAEDKANREFRDKQYDIITQHGRRSSQSIIETMEARRIKEATIDDVRTKIHKIEGDFFARSQAYYRALEAVRRCYDKQRAALVAEYSQWLSDRKAEKGAING